MATKIVSRENILRWDPASRNLYLFRRALEDMQKISDAAIGDERGYQWVAGVHGGFGGQPYCQHGNLNFITWHRPYVLDMELKLRDAIRKIAGQDAADEWRLPYWDWAAADVDGIPQAFTDPTYDDNGTTKPNPLLQQPYQLGYPPGSPVPPDAKVTYREPASLARLRQLRPLVEAALREADFSTFSRAIERPHNNLHVWVSGFMVTFRSAFDPIFWVHHANIDRQFWQWQQAYGDASIPVAVRTFPCQPFSFKNIQAQAFFDTRSLGYTYAASRTMVTRRTLMTMLSETRSAPATLTVNLGTLHPGFTQARIHFHGMQHTEATYELRLFANCKKTPDARTPLTTKAGFLGSYAVLGHGSCPGAPGHCDTTALAADSLRQEHHLSPYDMFIDVSEGLARLAGARRGGAKVGTDAGVPLTLFLVVVDMEHAQVPHDVVTYDNLSLTTD